MYGIGWLRPRSNRPIGDSYAGGKNVDVPAVETRVADTIGAGESFHAGLISWLHRNHMLSLDRIRGLSPDLAREAIRFAAEVAAITCSRPGANPPYLGEVGR